MNYSTLRTSLLACTIVATSTSAWAGQAPGAAFSPDIPVSHRDRVYAAEQFSNTVSVTDPVDNKLLGVIRLGDPQPGNFSPLHKGQGLGPGMQIFSPDGKYGYICSSFNPETVVVTVADHAIVARVKQESPFCPNIAATPDGDQVWFTLKDIGRTQVFNAKPPFNPIKTIETGPITNHVNFA